ncbi:MAG: 1-deoxy-D-xylulose-5-phosphate synthase [Deferribacteraceae bacterium]|jgi:1-deoxy-D-xylulose-5-phosphate synthase|nr:1-deoxy-D-xylulose-5-phosphate synthase [Deferribacteraceae bacterium]
MTDSADYSLLGKISLPEGIKKLSYEELDRLADETRRAILRSVSKNGGHLGSSLGVVELTIALLRVTEPETDRIVWDVGHQSYPFKVLTDRFSRFDTLRTFGGISGFPKPSESKYDAFSSGHASTSISACLGMATADALNGAKRKIAAVIGDASLSGGMAFEGLNHLGASKTPILVILNDNEMSINHNVGALSATLSRMLTGDLSITFRRDLRRFLEGIQADGITKLARKIEEGAISFFTPGILFEELGLRYMGPIDGHKIKDIEKALSTAFGYKDRPVLLHVATVKGKGFPMAEKNPENYHSISSFDPDTGKSKKFNGAKTWTDAFGEILIRLAEKDEKIVAISAAMKDGVGLTKFAELFPKRFFDVGIAEAHAMTFAAGLAAAGMKPYFAVYSSFLQRAFDQTLHDVALQKLPVKICVDRSGLVGQDGPTHHGVFDLSYLRQIPDVAIFLPRNLYEFEKMLALSMGYNAPLAIRYARGAPEYDNVPNVPVILGEPEIIDGEGEVAIISAGHIFPEALDLYSLLKTRDVRTALINLRFVRPLNIQTLLNGLKGKKLIVTLEENVRSGGVGEMLAPIISEHYPRAAVHIAAIPDEFITHGKVKELREYAGLTAQQIFAAISPMLTKRRIIRA